MQVMVITCSTAFLAGEYHHAKWWRIMELPALPPIGTMMEFRPPHPDWDEESLQVTHIYYQAYFAEDDTCPHLGYVVDTEAWGHRPESPDFTDVETFITFYEGFVADGWQCSGEVTALYQQLKGAANAND